MTPFLAAADLLATTRSLFSGALACYQGNPRATAWLRHHLDRLEQPIQVAIVGGPRSGKSTLVNALVGEEVAPLAAGARPVTCYRGGPVPRVRVHAPHRPPWEIPAERRNRGLRLATGNQLPRDVDRVVVDWPARLLRDLTLIDTPPLTGDGPAHQAAVQADAVVHLTRHLPGTELPLLTSLQDNTFGPLGPVSALVVLSRADEIAGGGIDALSSAKQLARRFRGDPRAQVACQAILPFAGLVATAGRTLRDEEFALLQHLSTVPREEREDLLLSADRFLAAEQLPASEDERRWLVERWGLFGLRLTTALIRTGCGSAVQLAAQLAQRSGLSDVREMIRLCFVERAEVLKARTAWLALDVLLRSEPRPGTRELAADLERVAAGAHDFAELRLLAALESGRVQLPGDLADRARQLAGSHGTTPHARLAQDPDAGVEELHLAVSAELRDWRDHMGNPAFTADQREAARIVARSCAGMLIRLTG
ncbi:GTPase [Longimycelium tulufanense]|uniref:GTPase n=1 Tax=Longimycelium tulufanense TaxID=907463 RepID=A0A8J3CGB2_9PSEU|nr:hypothetical protein [Longimycelium tulufanense]GGM63320.1 GTPase [Longimycelium tulufanense]